MGNHWDPLQVSWKERGNCHQWSKQYLNKTSKCDSKGTYSSYTLYYYAVILILNFHLFLKSISESNIAINWNNFSHKNQPKMDSLNKIYFWTPDSYYLLKLLQLRLFFLILKILLVLFHITFVWLYRMQQNKNRNYRLQNVFEVYRSILSDWMIFLVKLIYLQPC